MYTLHRVVPALFVYRPAFTSLQVPQQLDEGRTNVSSGMLRRWSSGTNKHLFVEGLCSGVALMNDNGGASACQPLGGFWCECEGIGCVHDGATVEDSLDERRKLKY